MSYIYKDNLKLKGLMEQNNSINLPENINLNLNSFVEDCIKMFKDNLFSIVLFGTAAEGRLRPTSDVNIMLVLKKYDINEIDQIRESFRIAHAAIRLNVMFILDSEISPASEAFAVKFNDIINRHLILFGSNPFDMIKVSRNATLQRLKQVILNLTLRLRERYALISLREEQLVQIIADVAAPIRSSAATIFELKNGKVIHPKEALEYLVTQYKEKNWAEILKNISMARETKQLKRGEAIVTILGILDLLNEMKKDIDCLR